MWHMASEELVLEQTPKPEALRAAPEASDRLLERGQACLKQHIPELQMSQTWNVDI